MSEHRSPPSSPVYGDFGDSIDHAENKDAEATAAATGTVTLEQYGRRDGRKAYRLILDARRSIDLVDLVAPTAEVFLHTVLYILPGTSRHAQHRHVVCLPTPSTAGARQVRLMFLFSFPLRDRRRPPRHLGLRWGCHPVVRSPTMTGSARLAAVQSSRERCSRLRA